MSFIPNKSTNLADKVTTADSSKTYTLNESSETQADGFTIANGQEDVINSQIQETNSQTNMVDCELIKDTMIQFSAEDSLDSLFQRNTISQFATNHRDENSGFTNIKKILERLQNGDVSNKTGNGYAVTWAVSFRGGRKLDNIRMFSGLAAIEFVLQSDDLKEFWDVLKEDSLSCIVIADEMTGRLIVIVKISAKSVQEYSLAYQHLIEYYSGRYGIKEYEFLDKTADVCHLYDLKANLKVCYNPYSRRLNSFTTNLLSKEMVDVCSLPIEPLPTNLEEMTTEQIGHSEGEISETEKNDDHSHTSLISTLDKTSPFDNEQIRVKLFDCLRYATEWYKSGFLTTSCGNTCLKSKEPKPQIDISLIPDEVNDDLFKYVISENQAGKKNQLISFLIDSSTGSRVICGEKGTHSDSRDKKRKGDEIKVMESLVKILSSGKKETGKVQKLLELEFKCSPRTIRGRIENIISGEITAINNLNKTVTLLKNRRGQKHFLSLVEVNQG